jgi:hypothetical protein
VKPKEKEELGRLGALKRKYKEEHKSHTHDMHRDRYREKIQEDVYMWHDRDREKIEEDVARVNKAIEAEKPKSTKE